MDLTCRFKLKLDLLIRDCCMCGICGCVSPPEADVLDRMRDRLAHRGPDESGSFLDETVGLGHRRLSVLDLATGQQPFESADGSSVLVFNGEIYNFHKLRDELISRGRTFRTTSDTEVLSQAYAEFGTECVQRLDGMFAFVLYDRHRRLLFGARDRMGKKPLYLTTQPFGPRVEFAFASEIKSLREHPEIQSRLSIRRRAVVSYLLNDYVSGRESIYEGIDRLSPGCAFVYGLAGSDRPGYREWQYWDVGLGRPAEDSGEAIQFLDESAAADELIERLRLAVERRMVADVPVGALLSGGIDSTAVVALMCQLQSASQVETFCIGFEDRSFDESGFAQEAAAYYGTKHRSRTFTAEDLQAELPRVVAALDEPFADPSILPVSMLCEFVRQYVTVALGGDGGDELFAGYDPFAAIRAAEWYRSWIPSVLHQMLIVPAASAIPSSSRNMGLDFKVQRFLRGATEPGHRRAAVWMGAFSLPQLQRLLPDWPDELVAGQCYANAASAYFRGSREGRDPVAGALGFFQECYLPDDILVKVDRASMLHSLEVRSPFLDTGVVGFVNSLPSNLKLRGRRRKHLLRSAVTAPLSDGRPLVPAALAERSKKGFGIPVARWIREDLRNFFWQVLCEDWPESELPGFNRGEIHRLFDDHVRLRRNNYKELWALCVLAMWVRRGRVQTASDGPAVLLA